MIAEGNGTPRAMRGADFNEAGGNTVRLRLTRMGDSYFGAYFDFILGEYVDVSTMTIALDNVHAGVTAFNASSAPALDVVFKNFSAQPLGSASGLTDIFLDGQSLPQFIPDYYEYLVTLPSDAPFPVVEAIYHGEMEAEVTQPTGTNPAAVRTVRDGIGMTYTIRFINGFEREPSAELPAVTPTPPEGPGDETEEPGNNIWLWLGLAALVLAAGTGVFIVIKRKKKK